MQKLSQISVGQKCVIKEIRFHEAKRIRFIELGLLPDELVSCVAIAPSGSPILLWVKGAMIAIRKSDGSFIDAIPYE